MARRQSSASRRKASGETNPANTFISNFQPPELWEYISKFLLCKRPSCGIYYYYPKQIKTPRNKTKLFQSSKPPSCPHSTFVRYFIFIKDSFTLSIWYYAIHFFYSLHKCIDKYLLCTYYAPGSSFLGARETEENKTELKHMFPSPKKNRGMERVT